MAYYFSLDGARVRGRQCHSMSVNTVFASNGTLEGQIHVTPSRSTKGSRRALARMTGKVSTMVSPLTFTEHDHLDLSGVLTVWRRLDVRKCSDGRTSVIGAAKKNVGEWWTKDLLSQMTRFRLAE
jgi:hypothetical protein